MRNALTTILLLSTLGGMTAGCTSKSGPKVSARPVSLAEFAHPTVAEIEAVEGEQTALAGAMAAAASTDEQELEDAMAQFDDTWFEELAFRESLQPTEPGEPILVDSLVGHINGRPVFADEFLKPIEDHLMRVADQTDGVETDREFMRIIGDWLREVVQNELVLAEAEAGLTEQEQVGLIAWLKRMGEEEVRKGGGTRTGAERRLAADSDSLDDYLGEQKDMLLINQLRAQKIRPRVNVSWRDVEREYERRYDEFNPPATVTLARIRLSTTGQAELIESVKGRLDGGEDFATLAEELGFPDGGLWETFDLGPGGITDIDVPEPMKQALESLRQGDTSEPFELGSGTLWLYVVELNDAKPRSIYDPDVQLMLRNTLYSRRSWVEWQKYVNSLVEEGIHDDLDAMAQALFKIAVERYAGHP